MSYTSASCIPNWESCEGSAALPVFYEGGTIVSFLGLGILPSNIVWFVADGFVTFSKGGIDDWLNFLSSIIGTFSISPVSYFFIPFVYVF